MPGRDGSGPVGNGPEGLRGRSAGGCVGPIDEQSFGGRGLNAGRGRGGFRRSFAQGRGFGRKTAMSDTIQPDTAQDEIRILKETVEELRMQLVENQKEITALKKVKEQ